MILLLPALAAAEDKNNCNADGRYWIHHDRGEKIYCFDGDAFPEGEAPKHVKEFFQPAKPKGQWGNEGPSAIGSDPKPAPAAKTVRAANSGPQPAIDWDAAKRAKGAVEPDSDASEGRSAVASGIETRLFFSINIGTPRKVVLAKLGNPHGRISNVVSDRVVETLTYQTSDGAGSFTLHEGRVITIRRPRW